MTRAIIRRVQWIITALLIVPLLLGCGEPPPVVSAAREAELVWPQPPLTPRIKHIATIAVPEDLGISGTMLDSVIDFLKGVPERHTAAPYGIAKGPEGRIYVVDTHHKAVQVFDTANTAHYWFPEEPLKGFENPIGIATGTDGRVYVSDSGTNAVHVFAEHGKRYVGAFGKGVLTRPTGLAFKPDTGQLLVADTLASQIVVFDAGSMELSRFVGRLGEAARAFHSPTNIAVSRNGRIYVTDALNFRVQILGPDFTFLRSFGKAGDSPGRFSRPKGLAADSDGNVYVVDALFDNVQIFDHVGRLLLAFGSPGAGRGQFWLPNEIFIDEDDRIYVSDSLNRRIQIFQYLKEDKR